MSHEPADDRPPVVIENVYPELDAGRFPVKRVAGDTVDVWADIFAEGHGLLAARLKHRVHGEPEWQSTPMRLVDNDRWSASFVVERNTRYEYTVEAWPDAFATWQADLRKRLEAGEDVTSELLEGERLLPLPLGEGQGVSTAGLARTGAVNPHPNPFPEGEGISPSPGGRGSEWLDPNLALLTTNDPRLTTRYRTLQITVDRPEAAFAAWYEMFPRSQGTVPGRHATLREAARRLPDIGAMGFDVVYLPPIHPIGHSHRKGPNNTLTAGPNDPGSPWAIGSEAGGHKSVHPDLGTIEDFDAFVKEAERHGLEVALDYALQCSPDHPYAKEHPDWFYRRPDGTIRYAENPPKKYEDIYPINFYCDDREALWAELKSIVLFWREHGVRTFRVDNPHTKPFPFWEWLISEVQRDHPEVVFLAEAFTRPKVMKYLAKAGFSQSYTYFTWRNTAAELREYLSELTQSDCADYLRGNLFANTPDILHEYLQTGGRPAFEIRLILAATLSSLYGIYNGYELLEATPLQKGSEEYLNSDKYQVKVRDWDAPGNIKPLITRVNHIRKENEALHYYRDLRFQPCDEEHVLAYTKRHGDNIILCAVNVDPAKAHTATVQAPLDYLDLEDGDAYKAENLLTGKTETWDSLRHEVTLDPQTNPAAIWRLRRVLSAES